MREDDLFTAREGKSGEVGNEILQDSFLYFNIISLKIAQEYYSLLVLNTKMMVLQELNNSWFGIFQILPSLHSNPLKAQYTLRALHYNAGFPILAAYTCNN